MKREELLKNKEYWIVQIQNDLFGIMNEFMKKRKMNRTALADRLGVSKGYVTQIFNGDFDHKVSKLVELSLASGKVPVLNFVDIDKFIKEDKEDKIFELMPMKRPKLITYTLPTKEKQGNVIKYIPTSMVSNNEPIFSTPL
jgi:transcriptional regulator with XRE-family HTH domain